MGAKGRGHRASPRGARAGVSLLFLEPYGAEGGPRVGGVCCAYGGGGEAWGGEEKEEEKERKKTLRMISLTFLITVTCP